MRVQAKQQRNQEAEAPINRIGWPLFTRAVGRSESRYGNIDPFIHSTTPVGLALGPDALFQGWLLLSQPPGCLCDSTSFPT